MARTTPVNAGYTIINGTTRGTNVTQVDTWVEYKVTAQSIANNTSTVRAILYSQARREATTKQEGTARQYGYVQVDSGTKYYLATTFNFENHAICKFADHTFTITHNTNGTKTIAIKADFDISAYVGPYLTGGSVSSNVTLPTIPQYSSVTQTVSARTETSLTIFWTSDQTVDRVSYSYDNGSTWSAVASVNTTSGSFSISGLTANTTYSVKTRVRNKTSQLVSDSAALSAATYSYPYCSSMPNFKLGNAVKLGFYNPLGREIQFNIIGNQNIQLPPTWTISGTSYTGLNSMTTTVPQLYQQIPSSTSGTYKVKVTYGSSSITRTGGTYSANAENSSPTIGSFTYADVNSTTTAITGDNTKIIQSLTGKNNSTVRYTVGSFTTTYGATISSVSVAVNNQTYNLTASETSFIGGNAPIYSGSNVTATATATDSRGMTATKTITVAILPWSYPTAIVSLSRNSNFYSESTLKVDATYASLNGNNYTTIRYHKKKVSDTTYDSWVTIQDGVDTTVVADNTYEWNFVIEVYDRLAHTTYTGFLGKGIPLVFFDRSKSSVGINCFPSENETLYLNGINLGYYSGTPTISSGWELYDSSNPLVLRRQGRTVYFRGVLKPTATTTLNSTAVQIASIPAGFRPSELVYQLCQGSGTSMWFLQINSSGVVYASRFRDVGNANGSYTQAQTTTYNWFPFSVSWII